MKCSGKKRTSPGVCVDIFCLCYQHKWVCVCVCVCVCWRKTETQSTRLHICVANTSNVTRSMLCIVVLWSVSPEHSSVVACLHFSMFTSLVMKMLWLAHYPLIDWHSLLGPSVDILPSRPAWPMFLSSERLWERLLYQLLCGCRKNPSQRNENQPIKHACICLFLVRIPLWRRNKSLVNGPAVACRCATAQPTWMNLRSWSKARVTRHVFEWSPMMN